MYCHCRSLFKELRPLVAGARLGRGQTGGEPGGGTNDTHTHNANQRIGGAGTLGAGRRGAQPEWLVRVQLDCSPPSCAWLPQDRTWAE